MSEDHARAEQGDGGGHHGSTTALSQIGICEDADPFGTGFKGM